MRYRTTGIELVTAPRAVHGVLVIPHGAGQIVMTRFESRELNVHLRIFRSQFANTKQHLRGRIVLSIGREGCRQGEPVGSVVAIDCCGAAQRPDGRFGLAGRQVVLAGIVPGNGVTKPQGAICTSRRPGEHETHDDQHAQDNHDHDLPMDERGVGCPLACRATSVNERSAATGT